ncbi:MAG: hypothetical protein ACSLE8_19705 [Rhodococcus sp. (in: high G+C Gram-positive bacteria)]
MKRTTVIASLVLAAMPMLGDSRSTKLDGGQTLDSLPPGALAARLEREPAAGYRRLL